MKKTSCALLTVALLIAAGGANAALPPLQLEIPTGDPPTGGCSYVFGTSGFDNQFGTVIFTLGLLGVEGFPESIWVADLDTVAAPMDGNGILDVYELGLLGAALCEADSKDLGDVLDQFNANIAQFTGLINAVAAVFDGAGASALGAQMIAVGGSPGPDPPASGLLGWAAANPSNPCAPGAVEMGAGLVENGLIIGSIAGLLPTLNILAPWFAGMAGLSSEMQLTLDAVLGDLIEDQLPGLLADIDEMAAALQGMALGCGMPEPLPTDLNSLAANLLAAKAAIEAGLGSLVLPDFEIYGVLGGKTTEEPFSALGDYNEDDTDNLGHYVAVGGGGPGNTNTLRAAYVAAATSNQHLMPVAGGIALALLAGMAAIGGALVIRKK